MMSAPGNDGRTQEARGNGGAPDMGEPLRRYVELFEHLTPKDLDRFEIYFTANARFKDPFNDVSGIPAIRRVFEHMFATLERPAFKVTHAALRGSDGFLRWQFDFRARGRDARIIGASHIRFAEDGRIAEHLDFWDPAEQIYEKLPVLGSLLRWLKRRLSSAP